MSAVDETATYYRTAQLDLTRADGDSRAVPAALSSETPVRRPGYEEVLVHEGAAVDLSRAADGLPLLWNHNAEQPIGLVKDVHLADGRLRGTLHFSANAKAQDVWPDVRDGFLKDVSIGYVIKKWEESDDSDQVRVTDWQLLEASIASVPADQTVGVNRKLEGSDMPVDEKTGSENTATDEPLNVLEFQANRERNIAQGIAKGIEQENQRVAALDALFFDYLDRGQEVADLREACIKRRGTSIEQATRALLDMVGNQHSIISRDFVQDEYNGTLDRATVDEIRKPHVEAGEDQQDKYNDIVEKALLVRIGTETDKAVIAEVRASEYSDMLVSEMAREFLSRNRISCKKLNREQLIGKAMSRGITHSTSDFANILENTANKSMLLGYAESPEVWPMIARTVSVPDFKSNSFVGLSEFGSLPEVKANGEYTHGTFADRKESAQLATFGRLFSISRQALANDDLSALGAQPRGMGRAASRTVGDKVFAVLTSNPTLNQDGTALFDASDHGNDVAHGSGGPPNVTTLDAARLAMATQKDQSSSTTSLNIRMARVIVPVALETTTNIIQAAEWDPAEGGTTSFRSPNPFRGTFDVVADARLDDADAAEWFASADPNVTDTLAACFLNGQTEPFLESQEGFEIDGMVYKVRIDCVALPLDFRGLYRNDGN